MAKYDSNNIKIAILVIAAILLTVFGISFLKGSSLFSNNKEYFAIFNKASGLEKSNKIYLLGVTVGLVDEIEFINNFEQIKVSFHLDESINVPTDSKIEIDAGIPGLGSPSMKLNLGNSGEIISAGNQIESTAPSSMTDQASGIIDNIGPTVQNLNNAILSLDTTLSNLNHFLSGENGRNIEYAISSLSQSLENFRSVSSRIDGIMGDQEAKINSIFTNIESLTSNLAKNQDLIESTLKNLNTTTSKLSEVEIQSTIDKVETVLNTLNGVLMKINSGEGSLSLLLNDAELYNNLNNAARDLDLLILDIKQQPDEFIPDVTVFPGRKK